MKALAEKKELEDGLKLVKDLTLTEKKVREAEKLKQSRKDEVASRN
jgi:hypothetical protein